MLSRILMMSCFLLFSLTSAGRVVKVDPLDYNLEIDKTLSGIESAVRNQSDSEFAEFFSETFDASDWYRKFMGKLTPEQAETYSLSRFGDVKDGRSAQFTESIRMNDTYTRRTPFDAVFVEVENERRVVIDSLTVHDKRYAEEEEGAVGH